MTNQTEFHITPDTKVSELLDHYPDLEEKLISMSPSFKKLQNPILRKTIAKVATLRQVAVVGDLPLGQLINELRREAGQAEGDFEAEVSTVDVPSWYDPSKIIRTIDARPIIEAGEHPINEVFSALNRLALDELVELITPFIPAPIIDKAKNKGYESYTIEENPDTFKTIFKKIKNGE